MTVSKGVCHPTLELPVAAVTSVHMIGATMGRL